MFTYKAKMAKYQKLLNLGIDYMCARCTLLSTFLYYLKYFIIKKFKRKDMSAKNNTSAK